MSVSKKLLMDKAANAALPEVTSASMSVIDVLQSYHPGIQALALAVTFRTLCEVADVTPQDVFVYAGNAMRDKEGTERVGFRAVKSYMKNELRF